MLAMEHSALERIEIIGPTGRRFTTYVHPGASLDFQDDGRTLKIFVREELTTDQAIARWAPAK